MEKREILIRQNFFRQINSLVAYLVKPLISRNFCRKRMRENSLNFSTVTHSMHNCVEIAEILSHTFFATILLKQWIY